MTITFFKYEIQTASKILKILKMSEISQALLNANNNIRAGITALSRQVSQPNTYTSAPTSVSDLLTERERILNTPFPPNDVGAQQTRQAALDQINQELGLVSPSDLLAERERILNTPFPPNDIGAQQARQANLDSINQELEQLSPSDLLAERERILNTPFPPNDIGAQQARQANLDRINQEITEEFQNYAQDDVPPTEDGRTTNPIIQPNPYAEENTALTVLYQNFDEFDTAKNGGDTDGRISKGDLEAAAQRDDEIGEAARYILSQPHLVDYLDTGKNNIDYNDKVEEGRFHSTGGDGKMSQEDIIAYVEKREVNRVLQEIADQIDVAAKGGEADGVLSRADYEAFWKSGQATFEQQLAIAAALKDGAIDGEQGFASDVADWAGNVSMITGYASAGLTLASIGLGATVIGAPLAPITGAAAGGLAVISTGTAAIEATAGIVAGEPEHVVSGGIGVATAGIGRAASATIRGATTPANRAFSESLEEVLESTARSRTAADLTETYIGELGRTTTRTINGREIDNPHRTTLAEDAIEEIIGE